MAQFTIYKSTDASAPSLSGTVGSLVALLDACLVTGYGAKSAAGWTKPYTGTNKAAFLQGGGNGFYLRVQDDAPGAAAAREARLTGYETMSDVDTGTGPFPTAAQGAGGVAMAVARKSNTADATARAWKVFADDRTVIAFVLTGDTAGIYYCWMFGDIYSAVPSDGYRTMLIARTAENATSRANEVLAQWVGLTSAGAFQFIARSYLGTGSSVILGKHGEQAKNSGTATFVGTLAYPNPSDGGLYLSPIWLHDPTTAPTPSIRGRLRGIWQFLHAITNVTDGDTVSGMGDLAGRSFEFIKSVSDPASNTIVFAIETSNTLDTN